MRNWIQTLLCALGAATWLWSGTTCRADLRILSVADDVTSEFYQAYNREFAAYWKEKTGDTVTVSQPREGPRVPAQSILNGLKADVVSMDRALDIDVLHTDGKLIPANWAARSPNRSVPCTSTIVFIVRQGNPKNIRNWGDSVESSTSLVIPNPKTYSDGRYSYLAAWGHALKKSAGDEKQARESVAKLFAHVPVLDAGGPGAIRTDDVGRHHTEAFSRAYVEYLYSAAAQELAAQHFCRPKNQAILARCATRYKPVELLTVKEIAGGWEKAQQVHFADGGIFDQIHQRHQSHKS